MVNSRLKTSRLIALSCALLLAVPIVGSAISQGPEIATSSAIVDSVQGADRYATAVEASRRTYPQGTGTVVIATGRNWPDALGGTSLAGVLDAPILLVDKDTIPGIVSHEITRLRAVNAVILGGSEAVGDGVEEALSDRLPGTVERISGENRYETAFAVAQKVVSEQGGSFDGTAIVATGADFPDALAAASLAAAKGWPLYLAHPASGLPSNAKTALAEYETALILGGPSAVNPATEAYLRAACDKVSRIAGNERYSTAARVARFSVAQGMTWDGVGITRGDNFPDALAGGVMQGANQAVMLLTPPQALHAETSLALRIYRADIGKVAFYGGTNAVSSGVRTSVAGVLAVPLNKAPVTFSDANLEYAVRANLNKTSGPVTVSDMERLETFSAAAMGITNLSGLEHARYLSEASLEINQISNLTPLTGLNRLRWLGLSGNQVSSVAPLVTNTGLRAGSSIDLRDNGLSSNSAAMSDIRSLINRGAWVTY